VNYTSVNILKSLKIKLEITKNHLKYGKTQPTLIRNPAGTSKVSLVVYDNSLGSFKVCTLLGFTQIHGQSLLCSTTVVHDNKFIYLFIY